MGDNDKIHDGYRGITLPSVNEATGQVADHFKTTPPNSGEYEEHKQMYNNKGIFSAAELQRAQMYVHLVETGYTPGEAEKIIKGAGGEVNAGNEANGSTPIEQGPAGTHSAPSTAGRGHHHSLNKRQLDEAHRAAEGEKLTVKEAKDLQRGLNAAEGSHLKVDGKVGEKTRAAVDHAKKSGLLTP
jgi:hypothetical protein